jgi:Fe/S biogenesis protein NfuA
MGVRGRGQSGSGPARARRCPSRMARGWLPLIEAHEMIDISERAQNYFRKLLAEQGGPGWGIRLRARDGGTPQGDCELSFCEPAEITGDEWILQCEGFNVFVDVASVPWLDGAALDYLPTGTGQTLSVRAPRLRGEVDPARASLAQRVKRVIDDTINPQLAQHRGHVRLLEVGSDGSVVLAFGGGCQGCGQVDATLRDGIERTLREQVPGITAVRDATEHAKGENPYYAAHAHGTSALR